MDMNKAQDREAAAEWEARTQNTMRRSLRETLTPEMWWAIKYRMCALIGCGIVILFVGAYKGWLDIAALVVAGAVFLDSAYWTWYVKRGIDRRFEREKAARIFAEDRAKAALGPQQINNDLLGMGGKRQVVHGELEVEDGVRSPVRGPVRGWGQD